MTDEPQVSGQEEVSEELPTPKFTKPSDDKPKSTVDAKSLAVEVAELLRPDIEKTVQGVKDKRFAKYDKVFGLISPDQLEYLQGQGVDIPQKVVDDMRLRAIEERLAGQAEPKSQGKAVEVKAEDWAKVIEEEGLDAKNPEVLVFLRDSEFRDLDDFELQAHRLAKSLKNNKPAPPEQKASIGGKHAPTGDYADLTDDQLGAKLEALAMNDPKGSKEEREKIAAELERREKK